MKWNTPPLARTRESITKEAGKTTGKPGYSVKRPPIPTIPANKNQALIHGVPLDVLHGRMRLGERKIDRAIEICAEFTGDKTAKGIIERSLWKQILTKILSYIIFAVKL